jgi:glycogen phosphorylase
MAGAHAPEHGGFDLDLQQQPNGAGLCRAFYLVGAAELRRPTADQGEPARTMRGWEVRLRRNWLGLHIGETSLSHDDRAWHFSVPVYLGEIAPADVAVQLYADPRRAEAPFLGELLRGEAITGATNGHIYTGTAPATRPSEEYTVRIVPCRSGARVPAELPLIYQVLAQWRLIDLGQCSPVSCNT